MGERNATELASWTERLPVSASTSSFPLFVWIFHGLRDHARENQVQFSGRRPRLTDSSAQRGGFPARDSFRGEGERRFSGISLEP